MHASVSLHLLCKKRGKGKQPNKQKNEFLKNWQRLMLVPGESQNRFPIRDVGLLG